MQQYTARIINYLVELRSNFFHLRGHQNSSRTAHCKSNRFPISCIHQRAVDFLDCPSPSEKTHWILLVTGALLSPTNPLEQWVYLPSQIPVFWSEVTSKGGNCQHCSTSTSLTTHFRWRWNKQVHQHNYSWIIKDVRNTKIKFQQ